MSSIMLASRKGHQEVVKILLNHGADINSEFLIFPQNVSG